MDSPILDAVDEERKNAISKELERACGRMSRWAQRRQIWARAMLILLQDDGGYWDGVETAYRDVWALFECTPHVTLGTFKTVWLRRCEKLDTLPHEYERADLGERVAWARAYKHFRRII